MNNVPYPIQFPVHTQEFWEELLLGPIQFPHQPLTEEEVNGIYAATVGTASQEYQLAH